MSYLPIRTATDATQFAGDVVTYFSCSTYFSEESAAAQDKVQYGIVSEESQTWHEGEEGHYLCKLLKMHGKDVESMRALIGSRLKEANLLMRRADEAALGFVKLNIELNLGYFEFMTDKQKVLNILKRQLATTPSEEA